MKRSVKLAAGVVLWLCFVIGWAGAADYESGWGKGLTDRDAQAREKLKEIAGQLCSPEDSDEEKVRILNRYVCDIAQYDWTGRYSGLTDLVMEGQAVCLGYAEALAYLLDCVGVKNFTITSFVQLENGAREVHIWNAVYIGGKWLHVDPTWNDTSRDAAHPDGRYFLLSGDQIKESRILHLKSDADYENYYQKTRTITTTFEVGCDNLHTIQDGRTLLPLREVIFALGGYVREEKDGTATILLGTSTLTLKAGSLVGTVDGKEFAYDVAPQQVDGNLLIPLRMTLEQLGARVSYDDAARQVIVQYDAYARFQQTEE